MVKSESKDEKPQKEHRFSQEQYNMLKRCSDKKDMTEWNEWRKAHPDENILLEGTNLIQFYLKGAFLNRAITIDKSGRVYEFNRVIEEPNMASFNEKVESIGDIYLVGAKLRRADLEGALFYYANLKSADVSNAKLEAAEFWRTEMQDTNFGRATVDGGTLIWNCKVSRYSKNKSFTNFEGVGLDSARIDPGTKQLLEYNIRRKNWEKWYKEHPFLKWLVKTFWLMSDYGLSTGRIIFTFFGLALVFANIYYHWGRLSPPGIVSNLFIDENGLVVEWWLAPLRSLYFSIVTMTTLGFGDMYAYAHSVWGHIFLSIQVIFGYVLLGALVTRFAVLFTAGGPAGRFANEQKKKDKIS